MTRRTRKREETNGDLLRALIARIEHAVDTAPPHKAAALIPRLAPLVERLVDARAAEEARRAREDENALRIAFDDEARRLIDERALEFAQAMLNPPDWELDNRAKQIARSEGGHWLDHLPRVYEEHAAFVQGLIHPPREDTDIRRMVREERARRPRAGGGDTDTAGV